jgi:hypothetical protein
MTGVSVIQYYAGDVFKAIGFSYERTFLFQTINSVIALVAQALCILTIDRVSPLVDSTIDEKLTGDLVLQFGRRPPLIICNIMSAVTFAVAT